jgi:hypothetical protein
MSVETEWSDYPILRHLTFGYRHHNLVTIIETLPQHIRLVLMRIVENAQTNWNERIDYLKSVENLCVSSPNCYTMESLDHGIDLWEEQNLVGYIKIYLDPATQDRSGVFVNETLANQLGIDRGKLYSQFAEHSFKFPLHDLDFFFILIDSISQVSQNRTDR